MNLDNKPLASIEEADLEDLITNEVGEGKTIDYKENEPAAASQKKDFLVDVSSFANTIGGHLIYGMKERNGFPVDLCGFQVDNPDALVQRLDSLIRDGIDPKVWGIHMKPVRLHTGQTALVVRIPRSYSAPHMVLCGEHRFYYRTSSGKERLDVDGLRVLFGMADAVATRTRAFRVDRLTRIRIGEAPVPLLDGPKFVLHIVPFDAFGLQTRYDLSRFSQDPKRLPFIKWAMTVPRGRYNFDGFVSCRPSSARPNPKADYVYTQCFRNAIIEAVYMDYNPQVKGQVEEHIVSDYEAMITTAVTEFVRAQREMGVSPPVFVMLAILGVKNRVLASKDDVCGLEPMSSALPFQQEDLVLPEVVLDDFDCDISAQMRPVFDIVLNAAGLGREDFE